MFPVLLAVQAAGQERELQVQAADVQLRNRVRQAGVLATAAAVVLALTAQTEGAVPAGAVVVQGLRARPAIHQICTKVAMAVLVKITLLRLALDTASPVTFPVVAVAVMATDQSL